ncbi:uncharacterized protein BO97DRAFT_479829 [Aspergillus homomorphus CBS 101889]|uniref:Phytanoyl-CoA dioxygenase n=1 Tax=Aspergillus homomorphus (strain CBS 101889) TaxID=1450537 RepID=A0A395HR50_ASPHC|nr:hypothetical protein BO97DRAFT_479829 [Aspergillus homomorphus CBS 101889]RAL09775.1 hypothetical protein BO97DRAFT_479829 [Aspergillus homomorphus CBS 101889]
MACFENPNSEFLETQFSASTRLPDGLGQNGGRINSDRVGLLRASSPSLPLDELRHRFQEDGYLFVKGFIPREDVLDARENYFEAYANTSLLQPGSSPRDGIFNKSSHPDLHKGISGQGLPVDPVGANALTNAHSDPKYRVFVEHPALTQFFRQLMDWKEHVLFHWTMLRHNVPFGLGAGITMTSFSCEGVIDIASLPGCQLVSQVPCDISIDGGGLCYLEDSAALGREIEDDFTTRAANSTDEQHLSAYNANMMAVGMLAKSPQGFVSDHPTSETHRWLATDYEAGDVVFHYPYTIYASGRNEDVEGRIRLSTDLRFYEKGEAEMDKRWFKIWDPNDGL